MPELILPVDVAAVSLAADLKTPFKVLIQKDVGFSVGQLKKLTQAVDLWAESWNSEEFKKRVYGFSYRKVIKTGFLKRRRFIYEGRTFLESKGLSNAALYDRLLQGSERLTPGIDYTATISVTLDKSAKKGVLGYTYPSTRMQWIYNSFFERATPAVIAGNLAHEYCHKLGFTHSAKFTPTREFTVVYAIGYMTRDIAKEIWNG
jgi:hypothetical protein